jgi:hypothetical protein
MSESKHTPGPWEAHESDDGHEIHMGERVGSGHMYQTQHILGYDHGLSEEDGKQFEEAEANAWLIAAAPDLLAACKLLQCELSYCRDQLAELKRPSREGGSVDLALKAGRAAIAKAEAKS